MFTVDEEKMTPNLSVDQLYPYTCVRVQYSQSLSKNSSSDEGCVETVQ